MKNFREDLNFLRNKKIGNLEKDIIRDLTYSYQTPSVKEKGLARTYFEMGIVYLMLKDFSQAKLSFNNSLSYATKWFDIVYPNYLIKNDIYGGTVAWRISDFLHRLFFSGDIKIIQQYCEKVLKIPFQDEGDINICYHQKNCAYSNLALNNLRIDDYFQYFNNHRNKQPPELDCPRGLETILNGIMKKNRKQILEGLNYAFKKYNRGYRREEEYPIYPDACSIIILAKMNDVDIMASDIDIKYQKHISIYFDNIFLLK